MYKKRHNDAKIILYLPTKIQAAMQTRTIALLSALCLMTAARPNTYLGTQSRFKTQVEETNNDVVNQLYDGCSVMDSESGTSSVGHICMALLFSCMLQAMATIADGSTFVGAINSTKAGAVTSGPMRKRQAASSIRTAISDGWTGGALRGGTVRMEGTAPSHLHPYDGVAFRTNVHTDDSTLFVHTNGDNATIQFERDPTETLQRRTFLNTFGHHFRFAGAQGLKIQALGLRNDHRGQNYVPDLVAFAYAFAYGDGYGAVFQQGDVWSFVLCDPVGDTTILNGKVVAELRDFGSNYESSSSRTVQCN